MFIYDYSSNYLKKYLFSGQKGDLYEYNTLYTERL